MKNTIIPLSTTNKGQKVVLKNIEGGHQLRQRLTAMGLLPGTEILVIKNSHPGPFVLKVRESKIVLGRGMASKINVKII